MKDKPAANRTSRRSTEFEDNNSGDTTAPTNEEIVQTAATAAEAVIFGEYKQSNVRDFDVTVTFEEGVLDVDVYLNAPEDGDPDRVADRAATAALQAVDALFEN